MKAETVAWVTPLLHGSSDEFSISQGDVMGSSMRVGMAWATARAIAEKE